MNFSFFTNDYKCLFEHQSCEYKGTDILFPAEKNENIFANLKLSACWPVESMPTWYLFKGKLFIAIKNMSYYLNIHDLNVNSNVFVNKNVERLGSKLETAIKQYMIT